MANAVPGLAVRGYNTLRGGGYLGNSMGLYNVMTDVGRVAETTSKIGTGLNAIGTVASGIRLGKDIYDSVKDGKVSFDTAMRMSDDATGIVSSIVSTVNPLAGLALTAGEKLVTSMVKGAEAVKEEKKKEGVKHLKPGVWLDTVVKASTPAWMTTDIGSAYRKWKQDKPKRKAERAQRKAEWKKMSGKEKAKRFFFG
jgi:hypothetical protein